ncbi:MAG TPA: Tol-Pal system beta propeller repeat protein TolB [Acidobacteriota bacterium]|nr:Tol-Pal system beta propeller repeat protein TolB [Acidobacteriota bacterium]
MKRHLLLVVLSLAAFASASAQDERVRNVLFDTLRTGDVQPTPIGVDEMKYVGNRYITADDSALMRYTTTIIQRDLDFYADFDLVPLDSFYLKTYEIFELDLLGWERLGADLVVKLEAEFPGRNLRVAWKLFETVRRRQVANGRLEYNRAYWRELGHDIANEVVYNLTGERGIFRTKIAYIRKIEAAKELFVADYDGANERQLTSNGSTNLSPAFAPDGDELYFTSYVEGDPQLFKVDISTGEVTKVASFPGLVAAAAVSPDGDKIACVLTRDGNSEIYLIDRDGRIIKRLTHHWAIDTAPTWSPDGRMIAFSSDRTGSPQVYIMDAFGLNVRRLTYRGGYNDSPVWSQRGDRITFVSRDKRGRFDLASTDTSGTSYRILTELGMNENPHFSPDGKHIIFSSNRLGPREVFTMDISGRNQRRLTRSGGCSNPDWGPLR